MNYFGITDKGNIRGNNEDCFAIEEIAPGFTAAIVADGMGGHRAGEEASRFAVDFCLQSIKTASVYFNKYTDRQIEGFLKNMSIKLNKELYLKASEDSDLSGMGTTLVVCIIYASKYYIINVGDSRLYIYSDNLAQITKDHSYVEELLEMGVITREQAVNHPNKNVITRAIGTESGVMPDFYKGRLKNNDVIIICTDGLTNMVSDETMSDIIAKESDPEAISTTLVDIAKHNGGTDNVTVACVKFDMKGDDNV